MTATVRYCYGESVEVYEVVAPTQIEAYQAALDHVKDEKYLSFFQIDSFPDGDEWVATLRVHTDGKNHD